jgi:transcriptional regulator with XRE-family HTH domain
VGERSRVRAETLDAVLKGAGLTRADAARDLGVTRQYLHAVIHGRTPPSPTLIRDLPIVCASRLNADAAAVRSAIFATDGDDHEPTHSLLERQLAATTTKGDPR